MTSIAAKKSNSQETKFCPLRMVDTHGWWVAGLIIALILGAKIWL